MKNFRNIENNNKTFIRLISEVFHNKEKEQFLPTVLRRLTPTLWACTEPPIVTHGTPMYKDSQVVVVPAYGKVSKLANNNRD